MWKELDVLIPLRTETVNNDICILQRDTTGQKIIVGTTNKIGVYYLQYKMLLQIKIFRFTVQKFYSIVYLNLKLLISNYSKLLLACRIQLSFSWMTNFLDPGF